MYIQLNQFSLYLDTGLQYIHIFIIILFFEMQI